MKTSELTGAALDWAVAKCEGGYDLRLVSTYGTKAAWQYTMMDEDEPERIDRFYLSDISYSTDWQLAGPIIEREKIAAVYRAGGYWMAYTHENYKGRASQGTGPTPLVAAMRCYVASKLGAEVEIPEGL